MGQPAKIRLSRDKRNRTLVSTMDGEANGIEAERFYRDEPNRSTERCVSKRITFSRAFYAFAPKMLRQYRENR
jgi:hypothetical protein